MLVRAIASYGDAMYKSNLGQVRTMIDTTACTCMNCCKGLHIPCVWLYDIVCMF